MKISLLFLLSLALTWFCLRQKRRWERAGANSLWYFFFERCVRVFVSLTLVTLFYAILALLVEGTSDTTTLSRLEFFEHVLDSIKSFVGHFMFPPLITALIIFGLIAIDLFLVNKNIASRYKHYQKWTGRVYLVIVLLTSFTFFGNQMGEPRAHLRVRTDKIKTGYRTIREESEALLAAHVQQVLYDKVRAALPPEFDYALNEPPKMDSPLDSLRTNYQAAQEQGVTDSEADQILKRYDSRPKDQDQSTDEIVSYAEVEQARAEPKTASGSAESEDPVIPVGGESKLSVAVVEKTVASLKAPTSLRSRLVTLMKLNDFQELLCQFPKSFTHAVKSRAFKSVAASHPLLEPIVDIFVGTFDKYIDEQVKKSADKVAATLLDQPENADNSANEEAAKLASSITVNIPSKNLALLKKLETDQAEQVKEITIVNERIQAQVQEIQKNKTEPIRPDETDNAVEPCVCVCSRNGVTRTLGSMPKQSCHSACSALGQC